MIAVNDSIKNAFNEPTTQRKPYIKVGNNSYYIQNMDLQADCYNEGNVIGNAIAKILKFDIETVNVSELDEFELYDSIWTGTQYESIFLGTFKLYDEEGTDDYFSKITAYDKLLFFNAQYNPNSTTYPTTIYGLLQNICLQAGVELENTSIVNGRQSLDSNLFVEGETLKIILNAICQISGTYAIISNDKLKLTLKGSETVTLTDSQISNPEFKRTTWNINQVVLGMTDVDGEYVKYPDDTEISGTIHKLVINDNPFVYTQALRETYIQNIYNQVNGFGYEAFSTTWEGLSYVELGDQVSASGHTSIVLRYNLKSPKGLDSTLEAPSIIDSVVQYVDNSNSIENRQKRTEYIVNKAIGEIDLIVEETNSNSQNIYDQSQQINSINSQIQNLNVSIEGLTNTMTKIGGGNLIKDSLGALNDGDWTNQVSTIRDTYTLENSIAGQGIMLNSGTIEQQIQLPNEVHTLSFKYKKNLSTANVKLYLNDTEYVLDQTNTTEFSQQITISNNTLNVKFVSDTDNSCYILDLLLNLGSTKDTWTQNANETVTNTVKIGVGIQVENSNNNTYWRADADGSRVFNKTTDEVVQEATDKGTRTNELISQSTSIINGVLFAKVGTHRWISGV